MRIVVHTDGDSQRGGQSELEKAMHTLKVAGVVLDGGGLIGTAGQWAGVVLLRYNDDAVRALEILKLASITAST